MMKNVRRILKETVSLAQQAVLLLPLPKIVVDKAWATLWSIQAKYCADVDRLHAKKWRQFCHTMHRKNVICCARETNDLTDENIRGLMFHELAHIIAEQHTDLLFQDSGLQVEQDERGQPLFFMGDQEVDPEIFADALAERIFQVRIYYDQNKLQWVENQV